MLVRITRDYTYKVDQSTNRTLFSGRVYDEPEHLVDEIVEAGCGEALSGQPADADGAIVKKAAKSKTKADADAPVAGLLPPEPSGT